MSPKTEDVALETVKADDVPEITPEEFPGWFALADQAMMDYESGKAEPWP